MVINSDLIKLAKFIGSSIDFVQGAGGNVSYKKNNVLWIKASGTRLKDVEKQNIFVDLNLEKTKKQVLLTENLIECCLGQPANSNLKPSIETAIHSLLPHTFVAHAHSIGAIALSTQANAPSKLAKVRLDIEKVFVPYAKPGIPLAQQIISTLGEKLMVSKNDLVILLGNHGLIVASENSTRCIEIIHEIESLFSKKIGVINKSSEQKTGNFIQIYAPNTLDSKSRAYLLTGPLTPDQVVYLGAKPFNTFDNNIYSNLPVLLNIDGSVWINSGLSNDAKEIVESYIKISLIVDLQVEINYLNSFEVSEILNWDAEKWRKDQEN